MASLASHASFYKQHPRALSAADRQDSNGSGYWMHELSYSSLESNDSGYTQQAWLPDELCTNCMICQKPFGLWRWTHHCRDCGGLYCHECSTHRVRSSAKDGPATLRVCDRCAFSPAYPEHLGCERPFACSRCSLPRGPKDLSVYLALFIRQLLCCVPCIAAVEASKRLRGGSSTDGARPLPPIGDFVPPGFVPTAPPPSSEGGGGKCASRSSPSASSAAASAKRWATLNDGPATQHA